MLMLRRWRFELRRESDWRFFWSTADLRRWVTSKPSDWEGCKSFFDFVQYAVGLNFAPTCWYSGVWWKIPGHTENHRTRYSHHWLRHGVMSDPHRVISSGSEPLLGITAEFQNANEDLSVPLEFTVWDHQTWCTPCIQYDMPSICPPRHRSKTVHPATRQAHPEVDSLRNRWHSIWFSSSIWFFKCSSV